MNAVGNPHFVPVTGSLLGSPAIRLPLTKELNEDWLQEVLHRNPGLLPIESVDDRVAAPLYSLGREISIPPVGSIDNLFISHNGYLVIVETKLWRNPQARREVLAQILDYGSHARAWTYSDLKRIWEKHGDQNCDLYAHVRPEDFEEHEWIDRINLNLHHGRIAMLIVGDGIRSEVHTIATAVGSQPDFQYRLGLVELRLYEFDDKRLVVPVTLAKTIEIERAVVRVVHDGLSKPEVTVELPPDGTKEKPDPKPLFSWENLRSELVSLPNGQSKVRVAEKLLDCLRGTSLQVKWQTSTASIKAQEPTGTGKLISLAGIYKTGEFWTYLGWLRQQLMTAWSNEAAANEAVEEHRKFLLGLGLQPNSTSGDQLKIDLMSLAGREEEVATGLENLVSELGRIAAQQVVNNAS
jgi:hypothetical protein